MTGSEARHRPSRLPACVVLAAGALALAACGPSAQPGGPAAGAAPAAREAMDVATAVVATARAPRIVRATGSFRADDEVTVASEATGRIVAAVREVGDVVRTGDPLSRVDDTDAALEVAERRRALAESLSKLGLDALPDGDPDFTALPAVEKAQLETANAKARFERARTLHDRTPPLISDQEFDDLRTAWSVAESAARVTLIAARAQVAEARTRAAQLALAERKLALTAQTVPAGRTADGASAAAQFVVAERHVSVGDYVRAGDPLYRLVDVDPLRLVVRVPERRAAGVLVGRPARIVAAGSAQPVAGTIARIRPEIDPRSRTLEAEIEVPNPDGALAAGAFATLEIDVGEDAAVPVLPDAAIRSFAGVRKAFVVADGKASEKVVVTGRRIGDGWEVLSGVKAGDTVVLSPPPALVAGTPVRGAPAKDGGR